METHFKKYTLLKELDLSSSGVKIFFHECLLDISYEAEVLYTILEK